MSAGKNKKIKKIRKGTSKKGAKARRDHDFYPTEAAITEAFIRAERPALEYIGRLSGGDEKFSIWEPACGDGAMAKVIESHGFKVRASDIKNRGYGRKLDFLKSSKLRAPIIITNPPYKDGLPEKFIRKAHSLGATYLALMLKVNFWNPQSKAALWQAYKPAREYKIGWRPDFLGLGGGMGDFCWWVWDWRPGNVSRLCETFILPPPGPDKNQRGAI